MHVFVTGERQIGKSVVIQRAVSLLGLPAYGFLTRFHGGDSLYMAAPSRAGRPDSADRIAFRNQGRIELMGDSFDRIAVGLLREARAHPEGIILMDECGHLESGRIRFLQEVLHCLDGEIPVLGALRLGQLWHEPIKTHSRVRVFTVTLENRDSLPAQIAQVLTEK